MAKVIVGILWADLSIIHIVGIQEWSIRVSHLTSRKYKLLNLPPTFSVLYNSLKLISDRQDNFNFNFTQLLGVWIAPSSLLSCFLLSPFLHLHPFLTPFLGCLSPLISSFLHLFPHTFTFLLSKTFIIVLLWAICYHRHRIK